MTNLQASHLRPGDRIRRKKPLDDPTSETARAIYIVERVERVARPTNHDKASVTVHAGGMAFQAWEIERARYEEW